MTYGVSPFSSPREPHVRPVAGFPGQSDLRPAPSASAAPATGASVGTTWRKRITSYLKSPWTVQNGRASAAPRRLDRGAAPTGDGHDLVHMREVVFVPVTGHHDYSGKERRHDPKFPGVFVSTHKSKECLDFKAFLMGRYMIYNPPAFISNPM